MKFKQSSIRAFPSEGANVTTTTYTVVNLSPGIEYDFLILAGNEFGVSQDLNGAEATDTTSEDGTYVHVYMCLEYLCVCLVDVLMCKRTH